MWDQDGMSHALQFNIYFIVVRVLLVFTLNSTSQPKLGCFLSRVLIVTYISSLSYKLRVVPVAVLLPSLLSVWVGE